MALGNRIYLDHAATTCVRADVLEAMLPYFCENAFNPSSLHAEGRRARAALDAARESVARTIGAASPREIVFTGGGSESLSLALRGACAARAAEGRRIVSVATEHRAVLRTLAALAEMGFDVEILPTDDAGQIDPMRFAAALRPGTILASVMLANNETGVIAPIAELARAARARGVLFHTDAVQGPGRLRLDVAELEVDLLSLSAHKCHGPKGVGVLYVCGGTPLAPLILGGGQEAGLRAGTENVAGIVGTARALALAEEERPETTLRLGRLRDRLEAGVLARIAGVRSSAGAALRLATISNLAFAAVDARTLAMRLDLEGVAVSAGSACAAGATEASHVIRALGLEKEFASGAVRFSLGRATTTEEIDAVVDLLVEIVPEMRGTGGVSGYTPRRFLEISSEVRSDG